MELYVQHSEPGTKVSWGDMAKGWNSELLTDLMLLPSDSSPALFPTRTLKTARHLQKYHGCLVKRLDHQFSRMAMSVQPKLARTAIHSLASSAAGAALGAGLMHSIDRSGSTGAQLDGAHAGPSNLGAPAGPSNLAAGAATQGVGRGGKGGKKMCRLCLHILGERVPLEGGHGYGKPPRCGYQVLLNTAKDDSDTTAAAAAYLKLDTLLQNGLDPTSVKKMYKF
jgi:hypothetical protein